MSISFLTVLLLPYVLYGQSINDPLYNQQTYLQTVDVPGAWTLETGSSSVKIGILAPGGVFADHEDLTSRVTLKYQGDTQGFLSHGTIVAGI